MRPLSPLAGPDWFKHAVFYEVMVRSFADSNADGCGDFPGLTSKLEYLAWLGVDCVWLPPFFPSPLADGGYDVADYTGVLPLYGTLADFDEFVGEARKHGLRVIIDFVMNHTSSAHPWFQASRTDPTGPYGDYYVWADEPSAYADARIIFTDTEASNWTYDEVRGQYYWHRFFSHQPDLNFENPKVLEELLAAIRFWLDRGIDGFRLDAVPYLVEAEGTSCENLPGTHAILKRVRALVDREYPGRLLLCEANQWPAEIIDYFGDDDECQMAFHFPVMPRLFLALQQGSRRAVSEILAATPEIPPGCQWATFLRNHDELTLEMVSAEERELMWRHYAPEPRMRANVGIRRRLAPLVDGDERRIRLLHTLLLGLPGSPVLYYGDEIGMGDNIWLPDRDGVRNPMQWSAAPDGGFSTAEPADFFLPLVESPGFTTDLVNVAAQRLESGSLLNWLRHLLSVRRAHPVFGVGDFTDLGGANDAIFAFARGAASGDVETVLCLANLSNAPAVVDLKRPAVGSVILSSAHPAGVDLSTERLALEPYGYVWLAVS